MLYIICKAEHPKAVVSCLRDITATTTVTFHSRNYKGHECSGLKGGPMSLEDNIKITGWGGWYPWWVDSFKAFHESFDDRNFN